MITFRRTYFILAVVLFIVEVFIALYVNDAFVRPYVGDFLVVIFLYCLVRAFFKIRVLPAAIAVLLFAYLIEWMQYLQLIQKLNLQHSRLANMVLGNLFEWIDMVAYTLGIVFVLLCEWAMKRSAR